MKLSSARLEMATAGAKYTVRTRCAQCGREHITGFRLRHVSDASSCSEALLSYAKHLDFLRLPWCKTLGNIGTGAALKIQPPI